MEKDDARYSTLEQLHERRKQVVRLHRKGYGVMQYGHATEDRGGYGMRQAGHRDTDFRHYSSPIKLGKPIAVVSVAREGDTGEPAGVNKSSW